MAIAEPKAVASDDKSELFPSLGNLSALPNLLQVGLMHHLDVSSRDLERIGKLNL